MTTAEFECWLGQVNRTAGDPAARTRRPHKMHWLELSSLVLGKNSDA
jgi:hypothetical protein